MSLDILLQTSRKLQTIECNCVDEECVIILKELTKEDCVCKIATEEKPFAFYSLTTDLRTSDINLSFYFRFFCLNKADVWRHTLFNER